MTGHAYTRDGVEWIESAAGGGYLEYMAERPRSHGLFSADDTADLAEMMKEISSHNAPVWTFIYSLRREDAVRLGYDTGESWRRLLLAHQTELAAAMKVPPGDFRWCAAFHDEKHHPHIHMMVWSRDPKQGYLTEKGIEKMRSELSGAIFQDELLSLYREKDLSYPDACGYMEIICWGTVFVFGYNTVCSILKGLGDSKTPLFFVGAATILNVLLDVLLVGPCSMGTAGAAWATITAQGISFAGSLVYLRRRQWSFFHVKMELRREILLAILKVGLPTATQMVVVNTAYLLVTGMLNPFGTAVAAASGVGLKINTFAGMHCWAIGQAITAMVGQCVGAGQIRRACQVVRSGLLLNLAVTAAVVVTVQFLAEPLIRLFDSTSPEMIRVGVLYLRLCCGVNSLV